jgi:hypothetical protein
MQSMANVYAKMAGILIQNVKTVRLKMDVLNANQQHFVLNATPDSSGLSIFQVLENASATLDIGKTDHHAYHVALKLTTALNASKTESAPNAVTKGSSAQIRQNVSAETTLTKTLPQ